VYAFSGGAGGHMSKSLYSNQRF